MFEKEDRLKKVFSLQEAFMLRLQEKHGKEKVPDWPLDMTQKSSQQLCKSLSHDSMEELFEAAQHLRNSKVHRMTDVPDFDRAKFIEECVDAFKFFLELLIFVGVSDDEFFEAYLKKDKIIHQRLEDGY